MRSFGKLCPSHKAGQDCFDRLPDEFPAQHQGFRYPLSPEEAGASCDRTRRKRISHRKSASKFMEDWGAGEEKEEEEILKESISPEQWQDVF